MSYLLVIVLLPLPLSITLLTINDKTLHVVHYDQMLRDLGHDLLHHLSHSVIGLPHHDNHLTGLLSPHTGMMMIMMMMMDTMKVNKSSHCMTFSMLPILLNCPLCVPPPTSIMVTINLNCLPLPPHYPW